MNESSSKRNTTNKIDCEFYKSKFRAILSCLIYYGKNPSNNSFNQLNNPRTQFNKQPHIVLLIILELNILKINFYGCIMVDHDLAMPTQPLCRFKNKHRNNLRKHLLNVDIFCFVSNCGGCASCIKSTWGLHIFNNTNRR